MVRTPVYFVPGLGANKLIFEFIKLPEEEFECIYLEWEIPFSNEPFKAYAERMAKKVTHELPVLIGVSLGGIMVQEMAEFVEAEKIIIISSAKCNKEFPGIFKFSRVTKLHKLVPTSLLIKLGSLSKFPVFGRKVNERLRLYKRYLGIRDTKYWRWAIDRLITWDRKVPDEKVIHIHGLHDEVFPARKMDHIIPIEDGTHVMLILKHKWLSENLPNIIRHGRLL